MSEHVRECYEHAVLRAESGGADPRIKQDYLDLERQCLTPARSDEFTDRLTDFSATNQKAIR